MSYGVYVRLRSEMFTWVVAVMLIRTFQYLASTIGMVSVNCEYVEPSCEYAISFVMAEAFP